MTNGKVNPGNVSASVGHKHIKSAANSCAKEYGRTYYMNPFKKQVVHDPQNTVMTETLTEKTKGDVWFVYDGDCPICCMAAQALQIKQSVGNLHLLNAREDKDHPVLHEVNERRFNLDDGMVLKYQDSYYHGEDALHMMALLGSGHGWFNRMNAVLFRLKTVARLCYPVMRATRNMLLRFKGVQKIRNLEVDPQEPLFKSVFGEQWDVLPSVMKQHYAVRPFSDDMVSVEGHLDVTVSPLISLMAKLTGMLLVYSGKNIPVTVLFRSDKAGAFCFDRTFHFPDKGDVTFRSRMEWLKGNCYISRRCSHLEKGVVLIA
jgi:predicted DCC family thiol-disulfide oxidoreductase YuxK